MRVSSARRPKGTCVAAAAECTPCRFDRLIDRSPAPERKPGAFGAGGCDTTKYDVTIQHTDASREPGYQETLVDLVIEAEGPEAAFAVARAARPSVSIVQIHGVHGADIAFDGASWRRTY